MIKFISVEASLFLHVEQNSAMDCVEQILINKQIKEKQ